MIRPLGRDDVFSTMRRGFLKDGILEYVGRNPRRRRREIVSQFSYRYWVHDIDDVIDELLKGGFLEIGQDGVWDVIVPGKMERGGSSVLYSMNEIGGSHTWY